MQIFTLNTSCNLSQEMTQSVVDTKWSEIGLRQWKTEKNPNRRALNFLVECTPAVWTTKAD
jgi:hypothetical protein